MPAVAPRPQRPNGVELPVRTLGPSPHRRTCPQPPPRKVVPHHPTHPPHPTPADVPEWAQFNTGRQLLARPPQCDFPVSVGYPVTSYNLIFKGTSNNGTRACWNVAVNNACAQGADR